MTKIALITTTINLPEVLRAYAAHVPGGCTLDVVVAGDVRTPAAARALVDELGGTYLGIDGELVERWETHRAIGTHCIQRRNLALLHALTLGPDVIVTIDDDNAPRRPETYLTDVIERLASPPPDLTASSTGWFNPGVLLEPTVVHRGFPLDERHHPAAYTSRALSGSGETPRVGVVAGLTLGDPDVDAIERIVNRPETLFGDEEATLDVGTWAPFNTQNTAYAWEVAPLMQCLYAVGRYDDIWMSYHARRVMDDLGWHVRYGDPLTVQERNEHDLVTDLEREIYGYRYTPALVARLRELTTARTSDATVLGCLEVAYDRTASLSKYLTVRANQAWLVDADRAVVEGSQRRKERLDA